MVRGLCRCVVIVCCCLRASSRSADKSLTVLFQNGTTCVFYAEGKSFSPSTREYKDLWNLWNLWELPCFLWNLCELPPLRAAPFFTFHFSLGASAPLRGYLSAKVGLYLEGIVSYMCGTNVKIFNSGSWNLRLFYWTFASSACLGVLDTSGSSI